MFSSGYIGLKEDILSCGEGFFQRQRDWFSWR